MDDLHNPTVVPSGPSTSSSAPNDAKDTRSLLELMDYKTKLEGELSALGSVLDSHNATMSTPLTTFDGYPRPDIDVAQIRTTRARIIRLRNDHKAVLSLIADGLRETHAAFQQQQASLPPSTPQPPAAPRRSEAERRPAASINETAFAIVNTVVPGGPAETAGLRAGDRIRRVGDANWLNHEKLGRVREVVMGNEGKEVMVRVQRLKRRSVGEDEDAGVDVEELELGLVPRRGWGGQGLLGCHLLPL
ncbi:MAG: putative 26S proteasome regulatory subunit [Ramalina farinacea]|uniref:Probable 26S proteasome regulatory subunit p27 n=1 Tax=Ramalina farinacea TaxID=258253 RepID=A0AA43QSM1_9LECA|nr:putative 26S proteasome regulatory subunit [Ramalina farinacea]